MDTSILIAVVGCAVGIMTFFIGRQSVAKNDGERWGKLEAKLEHIQESLSEIKTTMVKNANDTKESLKNVHERIDNHLRDEHGMHVPVRN